MQLAAAIEVLAREKAGHEFSMSLVSQYRAKGRLSEKQEMWALKLADEAVQKAPAQAMPPTVDLSSLWAAMPDKGGLRFKADADAPEIDVRRPRNGKPVLYVTAASVYAGAISEDGSFRPAGRAFQSLISHEQLFSGLQALVDDPVGCLERYGKLTGTCGVCGRFLESDHVDTDGLTSPQRGIGPTCARRMGLM